jgi:methylated-DNA-[protein]-cysteine S-methyltransferase
MNELERRLSALQTDASDALAAFRRRAAEEGLLDVAYAELDSPLGPLTAYVTPRGLVRLAYDHADADLADVSARLSPRVIEAPERTDEVRRELDEYFAGRRRTFAVPIDWALVRGFAGAVLEATSRIPFGSVSSYREVAAEAGSPNAYRAAGNALGSNPVPIVVPCHRVLHAGGGLGGYTGGLDRKRFLLRLEGVLPD